eukprot:IDg8412t1
MKPHVLLLLFVCLLHTLHAQKGSLEIAGPVCNSKMLSDQERATFAKFTHAAQTSFPCSSNDTSCCKREFDKNLSFMCNATVNLCLILTPVSSRPGRPGNLNLFIIVRCARPGAKCKISSKECSNSFILDQLVSHFVPERLICAWDKTKEISPIGCVVSYIPDILPIPRKNDLPVPTSTSEAPGPKRTREPVVSSPSAIPPSSSVPACFPAYALVTRSDGSIVRMDELQVGDEIRTKAGRTTRVFSFSHREEHLLADFVVLRTRFGRSITLTHGHYMYTDRGRIVPAGHVRIGDTILLADGRHDFIQSVATNLSLGVYNPQTLDGDIVVDGFVTSTYTTSVPHQVAHAALSPLRALYASLNWQTRMMESDRTGIAALVRSRL